MSPFRTLAALVLYLSLVVVTANAHNDPLQQRGQHGYNMKRAMVRKRAPLPQASGGPVVGAAPLPATSIVDPTSTSSTTQGDPQSTTTTSTSPPASVSTVTVSL